MGFDITIDLTKNLVLSRSDQHKLYWSALKGDVSKHGMHESIKAQLLEYAKKEQLSALVFIDKLCQAHPEKPFEYWLEKSSNYTQATSVINWLNGNLQSEKINPRSEQPEIQKEKLSELFAIYIGMREKKKLDFNNVFEGEKEGDRFMKKLASFLTTGESRTNKKFQIKGRNGARLARFIKKVHEKEKRGILKTDSKYLGFLRSSILDWSSPEFDLYSKLTN